MLVGIFVIALFGGLGSVSAASLSPGDGLRMDFSPQGQIVKAAARPAELPLSGVGGFAVHDFAVKPALDNLVPNGGFEEGTKGWNFAQGQAIDETVAHTGQRSARLEVPGPTPGTSNLGIIVPVKPNTTYVAELWLRRHNVGVCGAYLSERDDNNNPTGPVGQIGAPIPKQDDVWLLARWKITTQPRTTRLLLRADIYNSTGTLWLDDFFIAEAKEGDFRPVVGEMRLVGHEAHFAGELAEMGLRLEARWKAQQECLRVDGVLQDTTGRDRAIGVRFRLPITALGWRWHDDIGEERTIEAPGIYRFTYACVSGIGECSIYPWASISPPVSVGAPAQAGRVPSSATAQGLTIALPLSQGPRVFILQYDANAREFSLTFFFGLTKNCQAHPSRAPFSFVLFMHDPRWGMRSALERYYRLFPESFIKRPPFEGYLNYANYERFERSDHTLRLERAILPDASDFGEGYDFIFHVHGCYDYRQIPWPSPQRMTDEQVMAELQKMAGSPSDPGRSYVPTTETIKKLCRGPQGEILYIGDTRYWRAQEGYNHTDQPGWGLNFRVNEDPDISPHLLNISREKVRAYREKNSRPWSGTLTADAIEGYMSNRDALDYAPEHLRTSDAPLTFGKDSLQPALVNTIWDFLRQAWWPLTEEYKIVTYGNANGYEQAFTLPFVDVPMTEWSWDAQHPQRLDRYLRSLAHHKIWRHWHAWDENGRYGDKEAKNVVAHMKRSLAYGIYPAVYSIQAMAGNLEDYRALFRQHIPALEELNQAGWEPVPYAEAGPIGVERFGSFAAGELHFTLRNWSDKPQKALLRLDRTGLGIPLGSSLLALDIVRGMPCFNIFPPAGLPIDIGPGETLALWIGTREQAAQHGFRLARRTLEKIERLFYTEMQETASSLWRQARQLAQAGEQATGQQTLLLAERLQEALSRLQAGLKTQSPVDLAKLIYRTRVYTSLAPTALLGLGITAPSPLREAPRGGFVDVPVRGEGFAGVREFHWELIAPWEECTQRSRLPERDLVKIKEMAASLFVPAEPPRRLLPYLLGIYGQVRGARFRVYVPVDVVAGEPVSLSVKPRRAFRGQQRLLTLTLRNALEEAGVLRVTLTAPARASFAPAQFTITLPPRGTAEQLLTLRLEPFARLGETRFAYQIVSDKPQFNTTGGFEIVVGDPVPQLRISRLSETPVIDGKLAEACWQQPPTIPELKMLADGSPATERTSVWLGYDSQGLYAALRCGESQMDKLVARFTQRGDPLYLDDDIEIFIQPDETSPVYQFAVNALGTQSDNFGNKAPWKAAAQRTEGEWTVEIFVPYSCMGLSGPAPPGQPWGMQIGRQQKAKRETTSWTPAPAFISREHFGEIFFE